MTGRRIIEGGGVGLLREGLFWQGGGDGGGVCVSVIIIGDD